MLPVSLIKKLLIEVVKSAPKKETAMDRLAQKLMPKKETKASPETVKDQPAQKMRVCNNCHKFRPPEEFQGRLGRCTHCKNN